MKDLKISPITPVLPQEKKFPKLSPRLKRPPRDDDFKVILDSYTTLNAEDFEEISERPIAPPRAIF